MKALLRILVWILVLLLVFSLGFLSCIGAIAYAGYYAYANVSVDKLEEWGILSLDTSQFLDVSADVSLTAMTIEGLVAEVNALAQMGEKVSVDFLIDRYGLMLDDATLALIPEGIRSIPFSRLFSESGLNELLSAVEVSYIYQYIPDGVLSEPIKDKLATKTFADVVALDLGYLLDDVCVGYLLGVNYELVEGEYKVAFADPENPTLFELLAPVELGGLMTTLTQGGDIIQAITADIGDVMVESLVGTLLDLNNFVLPGLFGDKTIADLIITDEATGTSLVDIGALFNGRTLGQLFGYTAVYENDAIVAWTDQNGETVVGLMRGLASASLDGMLEQGFDFVSLVSDVYIGDVLQYNPVYDETGELVDWLDINGESVTGVYKELSGKTISDLTNGGLDVGSLLGEDTTIGELLGYTYDAEADQWTDQNGNLVEGALVSFIDLTFDELSDGDRLTEEIKSIKLADVLGYKMVEGVWMDGDTRVTGVMLTIADKTVGELNQDLINDITLAEAMGFTKEDDVWMNGDEEVTGILLTLADKKIGELSGEINSLKIGEIMGYTRDDSDGKWYDDGVQMTGTMAAFADLTVNELSDNDTVNMQIKSLSIGEVLGYTKVADVWMDGDSELSGIMEIIADKTVGELNEDVVNDMTVADVMGYTLLDGKWYDGDTEITGIMSSIAGFRIGGLDDEINNIYIGEIMGYTKNENDGMWYNGDEVVDGIVSVFADLTVVEISDASVVENEIHNLSVADILGYTNDNGVWKDTNGDELFGIMKVLADKTVGNLDNDIHGIMFGEVMGYTYSTTDNFWHNADGEAMHGLKAVFADLTIDELSDADLIIDKVNGITLGEVLGYTYEDGAWKYEGSEIDGFMAILSDKKLGDLHTATESLMIGEVMGYEKDAADGKWYKDSVEISGVMAAFADLTVNDLSDNEKFTAQLNTVSLASALGYVKTADGWETADGNSISGIMAILADTAIGDISTEIDMIQIGEVMGYTKESDGNWYNDSEKLAGVMAAFADLTVNEMSDSDKVSSKIKTVKLADALGYKKVDGVWLDGDNRPIEGVIKTVADCEIGNVNEEINSAPLGEMLGYTKMADGNWYNGEDKLSNLICKISDCNLRELNKELEELSVGDVFSDEDRESGFLKLMKPEWTIAELGGKMNDTFSATTMGEYHENGIVNLADETVLALDLFAPQWKEKTIDQFIPYLISALMPQ